MGPSPLKSLAQHKKEIKEKGKYDVEVVVTWQETWQKTWQLSSIS